MFDEIEAQILKEYETDCNQIYINVDQAVGPYITINAAAAIMAAIDNFRTYTLRLIQDITSKLNNYFTNKEEKPSDNEIESHANLLKEKILAHYIETLMALHNLKILDSSDRTDKRFKIKACIRENHDRYLKSVASNEARLKPSTSEEYEYNQLRNSNQSKMTTPLADLAEIQDPTILQKYIDLLDPYKIKTFLSNIMASPSFLDHSTSTSTTPKYLFIYVGPALTKELLSDNCKSLSASLNHILMANSDRANNIIEALSDKIKEIIFGDEKNNAIYATPDKAIAQGEPGSLILKIKYEDVIQVNKRLIQIKDIVSVQPVDERYSSMQFAYKSLPF
jgi:hypothetical protein